MPELPQIQALAERLHALVAGSRLASAAPLQFSAAKTFDPPLDALVGAECAAVRSRAKYLIFDFGLRLVVHLSQGGRVDVEEPPRTGRPKGSVLRLAFANGTGILIKEFGTQRKAAFWVLNPDDEGPMARLGPEPFTPEFASLLLTAGDSRRVHTILRDQKTVAGIGRGYSDDILHHARISPYTPLSKLTQKQRAALVEAVRSVLTEALTAERQRTGGLPPKLKESFTVHGRHGTPCPRCGATLRRVSYEDYEISYCPDCQTEGRILADRRMSRLLR
jgi:formamidopyrimidine-DNA glycosylase